MKDVYIASVGMIPFGRHRNDGVKQLTARVVKNLFDHSPLEKKDLQAAWLANAGWGVSSGQHSIRGQVALAPTGIESIPIMNVENACAGGSSAFYGAYLGVAAGAYDVALAIGVEKMTRDKNMPVSDLPRDFDGFLAGTDIEIMRMYMKTIREQAEKDRAQAEKEGEVKKRSGSKEGGKNAHSPFMDFYSAGARAHSKAHGSTQKQLAIIAAKNHSAGVLNPDSQYKFEMTPQDVIDDVEVSYPLTRSMCAPIGDGAAAAILVSADYLKKLGDVKAIKIRASVLGSAKIGMGGEARARALGLEAYEKAELGPSDIDLAEVHDATAFGELVQTENMGFCKDGEGGVYAESGATTIGGKMPVNTSGGLECRGHPIAATGLAQIAELSYQLRNQCGQRQVEGAKIGLAENGGGMLNGGEAAMIITILEGPN